MDHGVIEQSHRAVLVMFLGVTNHLTAIQKNVPLLHMSTQHPGTCIYLLIPIPASSPDHHSLIPGIILALLAVHLSFIWNGTLE